MMQSTNSILMVRPAAFGFDAETAATNLFQQAGDLTEQDIHEQALAEFDAAVTKLRANGVRLHVMDDDTNIIRRNAIFPNNWISTHEDGTVFLYPMLAESRRTERRRDVLDELERYYEVRKVVDLSRYEQEGRFLEGTGSMVLDRINGVIYACRSPRTDEKVLKEVARALDYRTVIFDAVDAQGKPIYHTNVCMAIGTRFAVLADFAIPDGAERERVMAALSGAGRRIIKLRPDQLTQFAGNILEVQGREILLCMSKGAYRSLSDSQLDLLELWAQVVHTPLPTIEQVGGGSFRCMLAEVFLPRK
jgi:hypothetical protein